MNRLHLRLRRGERRKCLYKEQTSWRQEGRNEKAAWKEQIRADIWTLNPAHHWAPWPQRLSHNSDRDENRHTFQRWWRRRRRRRKSRLRWNTGLWEPHDKRLLLASMWGGSLCGREFLASVPHGPSFKAMWGDGRGRWGGCSSPSQEGHPRTRPQHQTEEPEWQRAPNLSVPYIPEPHATWKGKQPVANLDLHCRPGTQHPPPPPPTPRTHSWHTGASLHRGDDGFGVIREGIISLGSRHQSQKPFGKPNACLRVTTWKRPPLKQHEAISQRARPVINTDAL